MRTVDVRFVRIRNGADAGLIFPLESGTPVLRMSDSADIKMSLRGEFAIDPAADWLRDRIRPELIINGIVYPLGIFLPATVEVHEDEQTRSQSIEAYDQCWLVRDTVGVGYPRVNSGTNYIEAVKTFVTAAGITQILATPTDTTVTESRYDWGRCASYLLPVNDLLAEINYKGLWFNGAGAAVLEPAAVPTAENIQHVLDDKNIQSLVLPGITSKTDVFSAPNSFLVMCSNPDKTGDMWYTATNDNPSSPLSTVRRGRTITKFVKVKNIGSYDLLRAYAERLRNESMWTGVKYTVQTALLPGFGVSDVTALKYGDIADICVEHEWQMELKPGGTMTHELEKVVVAIG